ncbi:MAG: excinuclease ABC subunit UvrA [Lachnospiraceae bacterium]|nr:excinuclease ABC subunit UvrA [Lachnospiraceae bacterium]
MSDKENMIRIRGANENNLKDLNVTIPRDKLVVLTGLSGSGKSSLAFDTIFAEGQRRYMESLSSYARMFLGQMEKPNVESIEGLSPAIAIDQKTTSKNPRSTVATVTEIYDYLRLLYARIGVVHCPSCGRVIEKQSVDQMVDTVMSYPAGSRIQLLAPVIQGRKGRHEKLLEKMQKDGFVRAYVDGELRSLDEDIELEKNIKHTIEVVVDRLVVKEGIEGRLTDSIETVLKLSEGLLYVDKGEKGKDVFSENFACPFCGISVAEPQPRSFSFNNPFGACPDCLGLGVKSEFDIELLVPNPTLSLNEGAIAAPGFGSISNSDSYGGKVIRELARFHGFSLDTPWNELPEKFRRIIMHEGDDHVFRISYEGRYGSRDYDMKFEGILPTLRRRYDETPESFRGEYESFMSHTPCPTCQGSRLKKDSLSVLVGGLNISEITSMSIKKAKAFFDQLYLTDREMLIANQLLREIRARLNFLNNVGLDYLTLGRAAGTLSGGEAQRIRLATQIGSGLMGVLYILDEPSIGLHQRDNSKLLSALLRLRDLGNTLVVVEHDEETMRLADHIVDIGPGAGIHGGRLVCQGTVEDICNCKESITGDYLSGRKKIPVPEKRRTPDDRWIRLRGCFKNNLEGTDFDVPVGVFTCVTGVSGSGKSTFVNEILYKAMARDLNRAKEKPGHYDSLTGLEHLDKVIVIDQSPIGRTPRSNPATYTGVFDLIRDLFASTQDAKMHGFSKGRFSFNVKGGRCESCNGDGILKIEMHFLPDVYVPCQVCHGKRYNRETLEVHYKGKSIADVLDMTVEEAMTFFENVPRIRNKIKTMHEVGLSYIKLGQPSTELSGGEAQRIKLATELSRKSTGKTFYILDEPTTGLHFEDVNKLLDMLQRLVEAGNSVLVIEHNLDVIKTADYIIDLGPEGGDKGGKVIAFGTPEEVSQVEGSYTGAFLKDILYPQGNT